jgi:DNA-binding protein H-NS
MDLSTLSTQELRKLESDLRTAIKSRESQELGKAYEEVVAIANRIGVPVPQFLKDVAAFTASGKAKRKSSIPVLAKYRHPDNPQLEWSGRGRQPTWVVDYITQPNKSLTDMLIDHQKPSGA